MLTINSVCKHQAGTLDHIVDNEAIVVLPQAGQIKVLNEVGTFIWTLLDGNRTIAEIACLISQEYRVTREQAEADTLQFLNDLDARGIIQVILL